MSDPLQDSQCTPRVVAFSGVGDGLVYANHHRYDWKRAERPREAVRDGYVADWVGRCVYCGRPAWGLGDAGFVSAPGPGKRAEATE